MPYETATAEVNAPTELSGNLALWEQRIDRLSLEAGALAGTNQFPEWWQEDAGTERDILPQLKQADVEPSDISQYTALYIKQAELQATVSGRPLYEHPIEWVISNLGEDRLSQGFKAETPDGPIHGALLNVLENNTQAPGGRLLTAHLDILQKSYDLPSKTELLGIHGDEYSDQVRGLLLYKNPIKWIRYNEQEKVEDFNWAETQHVTNEWMTKAVQATTGLDSAEASDYVFSASRNGEDQDIIGVIEKFDHFGVDRIRAISKATGIHGLEAYSVEQLERMEQVATNPAETAERLANHDVTVVLINRFGDNSGVMQSTAAEFDDDSGRTLFFEITKISDIYRHMGTLQKAGIEPSSVVLSAHSSPGQFVVSDVREKDSKKYGTATVMSRKLIEMVHADKKHEPGEHGYAMHGMAGAARLVESYMQPSRAIDDDAADEGRKKIIFQACYAATETEVKTINEAGEKIQIGSESVISQLGKDLQESGVTSNLDIYGAPAGIQMHRTEQGVRYSGPPTDMGDGRTPQHAVRIRLERGQLTQQNVDEIALRKAT